MNMGKATLWVPVYDSAESLACCLSALAFAVQEVWRAFDKIIIYDNGTHSAIDSWEVRRAISLFDRLTLPLQYIRRTDMKGMEQIRWWMSEHSAEYLCMIDADVVVEKLALSRLWKTAQDNLGRPFFGGARIDVDNFESFDDYGREERVRRMPTNLFIHSFFKKNFVAAVNQFDTAICILNTKMVSDSYAFSKQLDIRGGGVEDRVASAILVDRYGKGLFNSGSRAWHYGAEKEKKPMIANRTTLSEIKLISCGMSMSTIKEREVLSGFVGEKDVFD